MSIGRSITYSMRSSIVSGTIDGMADTGVPTIDEINAMRPQEYKVLENKLRRAASRQRLRLEKSRLRDPRAIGYGTYQLVDVSTDTVASCGSEQGYGLDLHDVARYLSGDTPPRAQDAPATEDSREPDQSGTTQRGDVLAVIHQSSPGAADDVGDLRRRLFDRRP